MSRRDIRLCDVRLDFIEDAKGDITRVIAHFVFANIIFTKIG